LEEKTQKKKIQSFDCAPPTGDTSREAIKNLRDSENKINVLSPVTNYIISKGDYEKVIDTLLTK